MRAITDRIAVATAAVTQLERVETALHLMQTLPLSEFRLLLEHSVRQLAQVRENLQNSIVNRGHEELARMDIQLLVEVVDPPGESSAAP